jgi:hypothetical protein
MNYQIENVSSGNASCARMFKAIVEHEAKLLDYFVIQQRVGKYTLILLIDLNPLYKEAFEEKTKTKLIPQIQRDMTQLELHGH